MLHNKKLYLSVLTIVTLLALALVPLAVLADDPPEEVPIEEPVEEPVAEPAEETIEEPVEEAVEAPIEEPIEEPVGEAVEEPATTDDSVEQPIEDPIEEPAEEAVVGDPAAAAAPVASAADVGGMASTSKSLSTNFTLLNFGASAANVTADYRLSNGTAWPGVPAGSLSFTIAANGGQAIFRQYVDADMGTTSGSGAVTISSDQELGAVAQILTPNQTPSQGAYSGVSAGSGQFYVPLVMRQLVSASGTGNSQITIMNVGSSAVNVTVQFYDSTGALVHTETINGIAAGSSFYYDVADETSLSVGFYGSAVVAAASGQVAVVSNLFSGAHGMQTFNGFPSDGLGIGWVAPLFTSRLSNGLSTPIAVQNLSGASMAAGAITLNCTKDAASPGAATLTVSNDVAVVNNGSYFFNPVVDTTNFPSGWYGSCRVTATGNVAAFVQMRTVGTENAAAYEGILASGTGTTVQVPLVAKRLANGFATALTVQNLSATATTATFTYVPSAEYVAAGGSPANVVVSNVPIPANGSVIHNHRVTSGAGSVPALVDGWYGTVTVGPASQPIAAFVQLTNYLGAAGDTTMAHNAFAQ